MFWALNLTANRMYRQTASATFHISHAALDGDSSNGGSNQIFFSSENQKFLVCTLRKDTCEQVVLDLNFAEGEELCFQSVGSGNVTLTGYFIEEPNPFDEEEEDEESEVEQIEEDLRNALNKKSKAKKEQKEKVKAKAKSKSASENDEEEEDDDDSDFNGDLLDGDADDDEEDDEDEVEEDDEDDDDYEEEPESDDEEFPQPKAKQPKLEKPHKQQNGVAKENTATAGDKKSKKDKKNKKEDQQQQQKQPKQQQQQKTGGERVLTGGVKVEDVRIGNGPEAKTGKRAQVYYEGRLKSNNKVFDSLKTGAGFKFGIGRGEVIKGWEIGVVGMKVGGKRRITCPPHMAYGARGSPPTIPPNSTLVFEVELKSVN